MRRTPMIAALFAAGTVLTAGAGAEPRFPANENAKCKDATEDPAGCQPSHFEVPIADIPSTRLDRRGRADAFSSDGEALAGAFRLEKKLKLFRNFRHLHWVPLIPSVTDPVTGARSGGDLDADGDGRGMGIAGECIYVGHGNGTGVFRPIDILAIQPKPGRDAPVVVGSIPAIAPGNRGFDDREIRALVYDSSAGRRMLMVRNATAGQDGRLQAFAIDPDTCLPTFGSNEFVFGGQSHEFYLWHDPDNSNRVLVSVSMFSGAGRPDPNNPGGSIADLIVLAVTDENSGAILPDPQVVATFSLQDVGGPVLREAPDATGLFSDGRFPDFSNNVDSFGRPGAVQTEQRNQNHSNSVSDDGERIYVAVSTAGFFILDSSAVAHSTNEALISETAGCNKRSTNVYVGGVIGGDVDPAKLAEVANDCIHMVINDDPGVQALLASAAPDAVKVAKYRMLADRSRFDPYPPVMTFTGFHSAVPVPNRPSLAAGNDASRPELVIVTDEKPFTECPTTWMYVVSADSEVSPTQRGAFGVPISELENCLSQSNSEPNGDPRRRRSMQAHNPTAFKNLVFVSWYGQGIRAVDISLSHSPREVGYARTAPHGVARTYPVFKDGLIYWVDNDTGLHVAEYFGPRADELPGPGSGVFEGNATSPHR